MTDDNAITFRAVGHDARSTLLTITADGRLVFGEAISKDEATQQVVALLLAEWDRQVAWRERGQMLLRQELAKAQEAVDAMQKGIEWT